MSYPLTGSDGSGYPFAKSFGHTVIPPLPAIVQLKADGKFGGITRTKTIAAQKKFGFTGKDVDGIVGSKTIAKAKAYKKQVLP